MLLQNPYPEDYVYWTDCVSSVGSLINEMRDDERDLEVTYETMRAHCEGLLLWATGMGYDRWLPLSKDWAVGYYKSFYAGAPCYYLRHSAIEYIWIKKGFSDVVAGNEARAREIEPPHTSMWARSNPYTTDPTHDPLVFGDRPPAYHGGRMRDTILRRGLIPQTAAVHVYRAEILRAEPALYFGPHPVAAKVWGDVLFRFPWPDVYDIDPDHGNAALRYFWTELKLAREKNLPLYDLVGPDLMMWYYTPMTVPVNDIDVWKNGAWEPLDRDKQESVYPYIEVQSDLFRESGANATDPELIETYVAAMQAQGGWSSFPPITAHLPDVDDDDIEEFEEAAEEGYEHELAWSRPLRRADVGTEYASIVDGHHRAYAARTLGIPIRVRLWDPRDVETARLYAAQGLPMTARAERLV